tara:strand:+ start:1932 stop:3236 length:1305 start_codon:yes stop_codon:yes gene_type:complete
MANAGRGGGGQSAYNSNVASLLGGNSANGIDPLIEVTFTSADEGAGAEIITTNITVSGATTPNLKLSADRVTTNDVKCKISQPNAVLNKADADGNTVVSAGTLDSGLVTKTVDFEVISDNNKSISIVNTEIVDDKDSSVYSSASQNLFLNDVIFEAETTDPAASGRTFIIYPPEENLTVRVIMAGSAGFSHNGNAGGNGGVTEFTYTLQKNTEYAFKLGYTVSPPGSLGYGGAGAFFYEKGRLLVACGGGGASGWFGGNGGAGGAAGVAGQSGSGSGSGSGGQSIGAGQLSADGTLPVFNPFSGFQRAGKVESCTSGDYWQSQGVSACSDVGNVKFRTFDGTEVSSSATIQRGYKADGAPENGFRFNGNSVGVQGNRTLPFVGGGGAGAYGGNASVDNGAGGGGGSGYTNGSVNILNTSSNNGLYKSFAQIELL